jgi:methyl-accepting chemotaxis protein
VASHAATAIKDGRRDAVQSLLASTEAETLPNALESAAVVRPRPGDSSRPDPDHVFAVTPPGPLVPGLADALRALSDGQVKDLAAGHAVVLKLGRDTVVLSKVDLAIMQGAFNEIRVLAYVAAVLKPDPVEARVGTFRKDLFYGFLLFGAVYLLVVFAVTRVLVLRPLDHMRAHATRIGEGDLTARLAELSDDELGQTALALNKITESLNVTLGKVKNVSEGIAGVMQHISQSSDVVTRGAAQSQDSVNATSSSMEEMIASLKGIASNVEVLAQSAEESSSSILEMAATNDEVAENVVGLAASVEETTSAIEQMTFSIKEVAKNIEDLSASTEETSSSMNEMDVSIGQVEMNANETSKLAELVSADAATGAGAIQKTLAGIEKIKDSSRTAAQVIDSLGKKILTIGNILNVIDDVAEQTNLLALNAAIIAAQAGEHGKGFAVVADEIKDLAERTGASTKEINELVKGVQDESRNAVAAMERGVKSVDEGVKLGTEAEGALKKILESSSKASQMVKAIARATVEQSRGSKQVTNAINRIAETVQQIAKATNEQARGSEQIMKSAEKMKVITKHVERSSQEQARGSKQITKSIENISEMVNQLNRAQKEQTKGSEGVLSAMENIKRVADAQHGTMRELEQAIEQLAAQSETLRAELRRFRV